MALGRLNARTGNQWAHEASKRHQERKPAGEERGHSDEMHSPFVFWTFRDPKRQTLSLSRFFTSLAPEINHHLGWRVTGRGKRTDYITSLTPFSRFSISWECVRLGLFCNLPHSDLSLSLKFSRTWQDFSKNIYLCTWLSRVLVVAFEMNFFAAHGLSCPLDCGMLVSPPGIPPPRVSCIWRHRLTTPGPAGKF